MVCIWVGGAGGGEVWIQVCGGGVVRVILRGTM